jgi:ferredoxin, 2Fe-2S
MPTITYIEHDGTAHVVDAVIGKSLMQTSIDHMLPGILGDCGGNCACATCHGYVDTPWLARLPPISEDEAMMLDATVEQRPTSRLTCQIFVQPALDGIVVHLPKEQG